MRPGVLLAGDAAGFIDPMTGDGLRFAMRGGELAAHAALTALEHGRADAHVQLSDMRRREFASKWRFNRALRALAGSPLAMRIASHGADWAPGWLERTISYAGMFREHRVRGSRFGVRGSGFEVRGSRFKVQGSRFKVQGSRFRLEFWVRSFIYGEEVAARSNVEP